MDYKLLRFLIFTYCLIFSASFPHHNGQFHNTQPVEWSNERQVMPQTQHHVYRSHHSLNNVPNVEEPFEPPRHYQSSRQIRSGFETQDYGNEEPRPQYYQSSPVEQYPGDRQVFENPGYQGYDEPNPIPQNYEEISPPDFRWNNMRSQDQQLNNYDDNYVPNPISQTHRVVHSTQLKDNYGYQQQPQELSPINPNLAIDEDSFPDTEQERWSQQNQYRETPPPGTPGTPGYQEWPGYENNILPNDVNYRNTIIERNGFNIPPYVPIDDALNPKLKPEIQPVAQNNNKHIAQPIHVKDNATFPQHQKHFFLVHSNGSTKHIENLDDIVGDDSNTTNINLKEVIAIVEVQEKDEHIAEPLELPKDKQTSMTPQSTNTSTLPKDKSPLPSRTELHLPIGHNKLTNEDSPILNFVKPDDIMPIEPASTVKAPVDSILPLPESNGKSINHVPHTKVKEDKEPKASNPEIVKAQKLDDDGASRVTRIRNDSFTVPANKAHVTHSTNTVHINKTAPSSSNFSSSTPNVQREPIASTGSPQTTTNKAPLALDSVKKLNESKAEESNGQNVTKVGTNDNQEDKATPAREVTCENKSENGTSKNDKSVMWLRPDKAFWDHMMTGKDKVDRVFFYNIHSPTLVETHRNFYHFENGTVVEEYIEYTWDRDNDPAPIITRRETVVHDPED